MCWIVRKRVDMLPYQGPTNSNESGVFRGTNGKGILLVCDVTVVRDKRSTAVGLFIVN